MALLASGALLAAAPTVMAQGWGSGPTPRDGACFYEDANYRGDYFCVRTGESLSSMPAHMNDRISSVRIFGRARVTVFKDSRFRGRSTRFDDDVRNLGHEGWNDRISSLEVRRSSSRRRGDWDDRDDRRRDSRERRSYQPSQAEAERIVRRAYKDILDRQPDSAGLRLYRNHLIDDGWSEQKVRDALRDSREYRQKHTMTRAKAQEIVRRAYRAVLQRDPDAGSRGYVERVLRDHWTQRDIERELRKSAEYRNKHRR